MKICFVLPGFLRTPGGGHKMVYEYANRLQGMGYEVTIVSLNTNKLKQFHFPEFIRRIAVNIINKQQPKWFNLDDKIRNISGEERNYLDKVNDSDVVFATAVQTVDIVKNNFENAKKLYFIQGYENWEVSEDCLHKTYNYGFRNIVVSNWLKEVVDKYSSVPAVLLKNPIDTNIYKMNNSQISRKKHTIGLLYHTNEVKGMKYAMEVIYKLKEKYSDLTIKMFGVFARPKDFPDWIDYKKSASTQETVEIYNSVQVFLCAAIEEGYGLTGLEAMSCGACLVSTSCKGVQEYAENGYNAMLSPVKDVDSLVNNVCFLFENDEKRIELTRNGIESVKDYSWNNAMKKLCKLIDND
jgi:glycosyltransferase involved in cell wall biosynthesis